MCASISLFQSKHRPQGVQTQPDQTLVKQKTWTKQNPFPHVGKGKYAAITLDSKTTGFYKYMWKA